MYFSESPGMEQVSLSPVWSLLLSKAPEKYSGIFLDLGWVGEELSSLCLTLLRCPKLWLY